MELALALMPSSTYYSPSFCARLVRAHTCISPTPPLPTYQSVPAADMIHPPHEIPQRERRTRNTHLSVAVPHQQDDAKRAGVCLRNLGRPDSHELYFKRERAECQPEVPLGSQAQFSSRKGGVVGQGGTVLVTLVQSCPDLSWLEASLSRTREQEQNLHVHLIVRLSPEASRDSWELSR